MLHDPVPLIERDLALQHLQSALVSARQGAGRTALVCGEAGIGKTSLVSRLAGEQTGVRLLWGGCEALHSPQPLGPLYDMVDALGTGVRAALRSQGHRTELFNAVLSDLQAAHDVTLLVVEDLHWADEATLDLLKFLARRIHRVRALMVLTYRDDELGERHPLRLLLGDVPTAAVVRVPLHPLSEAGVIEMARRSARRADGLFATTQGNPFFVTEALRSEGLPASVRDAVIARAARQPPPVRALLDLAAIAPTRLETSVADALLAPTPDDVSAALASGLLEADGHSYAYRHELARLAIAQALSAPRSAALHARMLWHLEHADRGAADPPLSRLVHHAALAGESAAVLTYAPRAAAEASVQGAHRESAALYATALAHAFGLPPRAQAELLEHRAYQCYLVDLTNEAIAARRSALTIWRSLGEREQIGRTLRWLSRLHWVLARNREAEAYADEAIEQLKALPASRELAWALSNRAQLDMLSARTDAAVEEGRRALELATQLGDTEVMVHALNNMGSALHHARRPGGLALLEQSLALATEAGHDEHIARAYSNLAATMVSNRDYPAARCLIERATDYFSVRELDLSWYAVLGWQACLAFEQAQWDVASEVATGLLAHGTVGPATRMPPLVVLARMRMRRGDPQACEALDEATALALQSGELQRLAPVAIAHAESAWLSRHRSPLHDVVGEAMRLALQRDDVRALGELSFWLRKLGIAHEPPAVVDDAYALQFEGRWREAAVAWARLGCRYEQALALLEGDEEGMRAALALFESLGASAAAKRCREQLQEAGLRGLARGPRATTAANPAGLTVRELQVLGLLAQGLTNAEIADRLVRSEKTVDHHVAAVLRKLAVRTRGDAAVLASRLGIVA